MQFFMELPGKEVTSKSSALTVKSYTSGYEQNGFTCWAIVDNHTVTFRIIGTAATALGTSSNYAFVGSFPDLKDLITFRGDRIKRVVITPTLRGQVRFNYESCQLQIGHTFDNSGAAANIPSGATFWIEETFVL